MKLKVRLHSTEIGEEQPPAPPFSVDVLWFYRDPGGMIQGASIVILFRECHLIGPLFRPIEGIIDAIMV